MRKILIALFIIFAASAAFGLKVNVLEYDPFPAKAGSFADVFISIENNSRADTENIVAEFVPQDSIRLAFGQEASKEVGVIPGQKSVVLKYRVEITRDAIDGENLFEMKVKDGELPVQTFELSIEVDNSLPNIEIGSVESEPKKLLPDTQDAKISVTLLNTGNEVAENLKATIILPAGIEVSDSFSDIALIGNLAENSSSDATFYIDVPEETKAGTYEAKVLAEYTLKDSTDGDFVSKTLKLDIAVKPVPKFEISKIQTIPESLTAGDRAVKLVLEIKNAGEADAESVRIKVFEKTEQPFEFDKASDFVAPKLKPGETGNATLEFRIDDDAAVQKYLLAAEVKTFVDETVRLEEEVIPITVAKEKPQSPDLPYLIGAAIAGIIIIAGVYLYRKRRATATAEAAQAKKK